MLLLSPLLELQRRLLRRGRPFHGCSNLRKGTEPLHPFEFLGKQQGRFVRALAGYFLEGNADCGVK
jgi:hypothetical protein